MGSAGTPGVITDYSEIFRLDNVGSEVAGGACAAPDGGRITRRHLDWITWSLR